MTFLKEIQPDSMIVGYCRRCNKAYSRQDIDEKFCSENCKIRHGKLLAHWLKAENTGSKIGHKVAQNTGSSLSL